MFGVVVIARDPEQILYASDIGSIVPGEVDIHEKNVPGETHLEEDHAGEASRRRIKFSCCVIWKQTHGMRDLRRAWFGNI